jgi:hypothetical protein
MVADDHQAVPTTWRKGCEQRPAASRKWRPSLRDGIRGRRPNWLWDLLLTVQSQQNHFLPEDRDEVEASSLQRVGQMDKGKSLIVVLCAKIRQWRLTATPKRAPWHCWVMLRM